MARRIPTVKQFIPNWITKDNLNLIMAILATIGSLFGIIGELFGFMAYMDINSKIDSAINNPDYIKKVSREIRPYIIFDDKNSIIFDGGGSNYIDNVEFTSVPNYDSFTSGALKITPKLFLNEAPLLNKLGLQNFVYEKFRGKKNDWIYVIKPIGPIVDEEDIRYRLEILR